MISKKINIGAEELAKFLILQANWTKSNKGSNVPRHYSSLVLEGIVASDTNNAGYLFEAMQTLLPSFTLPPGSQTTKWVEFYADPTDLRTIRLGSHKSR